MRVKVTMTFSDEFDVDPADYIDPSDLEEGEKPDLDAILDAIHDSFMDCDHCEFVESAGNPKVKVENLR